MNAAYLQQLQQPCSCGKNHTLYTRDIVLKSGALYDLNALLFKHGFGRNGAIVCDQNTWAAAGQTVSQVLNTKECVILDPNELHADEQAIKTVREQTEGAKYYIAVGSGTIHDITKYVAHDRNMDFVSVPTAASVDGFTSNVAAMTFNGMKVTTPARAPRVVVADLDVLREAPYRLTASGVGDILGKYTALADWRIANLVTGEHICDKVVELQTRNIAEVVAAQKALRRGEAAAYQKVAEALLMSGIAMQMMGNSRPASGVEHHISHLWETHILGNTQEAYHGEKVGVGTALACGMYRNFLSVDDLTPYLRPHTPITPELLEPSFGALTPYVMQENTPDCLEQVDNVRLAESFGGIREILRGLPTREEMVALLKGFGAPSTPAEVGIDDVLLEKTFANCAYARNRLTLYRMTLLMDPAFVRNTILK